MTASDFQAALTSEMFQMFPASVREGLLSDRPFRQKFEFTTNATLTLGSSAAFFRNDFFDAMRGLYGGQDRPTLKAKDGSDWTLSLEVTADVRRIAVTREAIRMYLPDLWYLIPFVDQRMKEFERFADDRNATGPEFEKWRALLQEAPLENDDVELFQKEIKLLPAEISDLIASGVRSGESRSETLVPPRLRYFERLVGSIGSASTLEEYLQHQASQHVAQLLRWDSSRGLKQALLLSSHPNFVQRLRDVEIDEVSLTTLYQWLADRGDRISQVGAFELGLSLLAKHPGIETNLLEIARQIRDDDPDQPDGRLALLSNLIVFVEGGVAQAGTLKDKRPFWRRMATIAQASLIERELVDGGVDFGAASEWLDRGQGHYYYLQTLVDLRQEPRWLPDFVSPDQLKHELLGRLWGATQNHANTISSSALRELVLSDSENSLKSQLSFPASYFPGPLEGATEALRDPPDELAADMRSQLQGAANDTSAFAGLVNCCLVFKPVPEMVALAAEAIRKAKYLLRSDNGKNQTFALLSGLATVAAVSRSGELAREVRTLARVARRRAHETVSFDNHLRIGMVAAAAFPEVDDWARFAGEWIAELAFDELSSSDVVKLHSHLQVLLQIEPTLWETCARGEAALSSMASDTEAA